MLTRTRQTVSSLLVCGAAAFVAAPASAEVVYFNNFDGPGALDDFDISGAPDVPAVSTTFGNPSPSLRIHDITTEATAPTASVKFDRFDAFDTSQEAQQTIRFTFDLYIDSMSNPAASSAANPRIILRASDVDWLTIGYGRRGGYTGYPAAGTRNLLYVTNTRGTRVPTDSDTDARPIGFPDGDPDATFANGFDFGAYDSNTAANNGTDAWIRFAITYTDGDSAVNALATNLLTGDTTTFIFDVAPASFSNDPSHYLSVDGGSAGLSDFYFDNLEVTVTPEPGSLGLMLAAMGAIGLRPRRRN